MNHFVIDKFGRLINLEALTDNFYSDKIQMQSDFFSFLAALGQYGTHAEKKDCDCRFISFDVGTFEVIPNLGESVSLLHNTVFLVAYIRAENSFFQFFYFFYFLFFFMEKAYATGMSFIISMFDHRLFISRLETDNFVFFFRG